MSKHIHIHVGRTKDAEPLKQGTPEYAKARARWDAENKAAIAEYESVQKPARAKMMARLKENNRQAKAEGLNV